MTEADLRMAHQLAHCVAEAGGSTWYVGGYVRDLLRNCENKDIDLEIHGIPPERLEAILDSLGERTQVGSSFGIYSLKHCGLDIAMPRKETATGRGHRDFQVDVDPFLGLDQAARRRDFTINALMQNVLTGEIADFFGGRQDLQNGIIRHICADTYREDPLRVLRAAQFAARFHFIVADETILCSAEMDLSALPGERIWGELEKALLKSDRPSVFFEVLRRMNQLHVWFPELKALIGVPQDPRYHPEGDVWNHTMLVLDAAASLRSQASDPLNFMLAALLHDVGKPAVTTESGGRIRSLQHEAAGVPAALTLLKRITSRRQTLRYVANMTELHMRPNQLPLQHAGAKAYARLFDRSVCPDDLILLARADRMGQAIPLENYESVWNTLQQQLQQFHTIMARPSVMGRDLIASGIKPCPEFHEALDYAHRLQLAGVEKDAALKQTMSFLRSLLQK